MNAKEARKIADNSTTGRTAVIKLNDNITKWCAGIMDNVIPKQAKKGCYSWEGDFLNLAIANAKGFEIVGLKPLGETIKTYFEAFGYTVTIQEWDITVKW